MDKNGNKTGGRKKGAKNKITAVRKSAISELLAEYQETGQMSKDFLALEPKDRLACAEKLMQYVMPKMQSTSIDFNAESTNVTIEQTLKELSKI